LKYDNITLVPPRYQRGVRTMKAVGAGLVWIGYGIVVAGTAFWYPEATMLVGFFAAVCAVFATLAIAW